MDDLVVGLVVVHVGDALAVLREVPNESVHCVVTSPPYWGLRDYGVPGQLGLERTPEAYVSRLVEVFREVRRVLRRDGTCWLNLGDSYATGAVAHIGLKPKDLVGIPWRVAFALQADGWWLRSDTVWAKPNPMPESVTDRPTKAHEYLFLLTKAERYYYDADAVREAADPDSYRPSKRAIRPWADHGQGVVGSQYHQALCRGQSEGAAPNGRNLRSVWTIAGKPYPEAHFATFPEALVIPCIKAGCPEGGTVLDPFAGSGTTLAVARRLGRRSVGIELQANYLPLIYHRVAASASPLLEYGSQ